jgi:hypothetical protein
LNSSQSNSFFLMPSSPPSPAEPVSPIAELQQMLLDAGEDVAKIFGPALSTFAGPLANTKSSNEKYADMERLIMGNQK